MTSDAPDQAFVWVWLPGATDPVVAGRLDQRGPQLTFGYGASYLALDNAIPLYLPELPLRRGEIHPPDGLDVAGCISDAGPDSWGRRVINQRLLGGTPNPAAADLSVLTYLLQSGSNRIGALDFQQSATTYVTRGNDRTSLEDLARASALIQAGREVPEELAAAVTAGSSAGGARPKALLKDGSRHLLAKFSSQSDEYPIVRGEFLAMRMAERCGLDVAAVELTSAGGKDVLLVERFDRDRGATTRRLVISALTMLSLPEFAPGEASYSQLAQIIRERFDEPRTALRELFSRIIFNVLSGNTDDHARNHAALWNGESLSLSPAYDICPYLRAGGEATQAMIIGTAADRFRFSQVAGCIDRAPLYGLSRENAIQLVEHQLDTIRTSWQDACAEARMTRIESAMFKRVFPHPYALEGSPAR